MRSVYTDQLLYLILTEHQDRRDDTDREINREEGCVVEEGIKVLSHSVRRPLSPDHDSGDEVTDEAYCDGRGDSVVDVDLAFL